ncbi:hypothetical protein Nepgr_013739 [Nepenthes gracilis]|uniref:Uncharacterized protein n=1 Tax=Nepenthes gracilis TaxID=150966 RepID=A0AAD3SID1_NEPGR|nr:hypothetical protein Nepgr_013739 [Nepenthes gracilis]
MDGVFGDKEAICRLLYQWVFVNGGGAAGALQPLETPFPSPPSKLRPIGTLAAATGGVGGSNVFQAIEEQSEDSRCRLKSQNKTAVVDDALQARSKRYYEGDSFDHSKVKHATGNGVVEERKEKKARKRRRRSDRVHTELKICSFCDLLNRCDFLWSRVPTDLRKRYN